MSIKLTKNAVFWVANQNARCLRKFCPLFIFLLESIEPLMLSPFCFAVSNYFVFHAQRGRHRFLRYLLVTTGTLPVLFPIPTHCLLDTNWRVWCPITDLLSKRNKMWKVALQSANFPRESESLERDCGKTCLHCVTSQLWRTWEKNGASLPLQ